MYILLCVDILLYYVTEHCVLKYILFLKQNSRIFAIFYVFVFLILSNDYNK